MLNLLNGRLIWDRAYRPAGCGRWPEPRDSPWAGLPRPFRPREEAVRYIQTG